MTKRILIIALLIAFLASEANAQSHQNRRRGVILGGLAGAAIGVAIGDKGDNETAGALIGGAVGAIAGGTIGNQKDQRIEHDRRYHSAPYGGRAYGGQPAYSGSGTQSHYYQPYVYEQPPAPYQAGPVVISSPPTTILSQETALVARSNSRVSKQDVLTMIGSGMSDKIVIRQLEILGMDKSLSVAEVIELHRAGVSESVITAMQLAGPEAASTMVVNDSSPSEATQSSSDQLYGPSVLPPPPPRPKAP